MSFGAHRTWSPSGLVQAGAGDVVTINPGEMHDGVPIEAQPRAWKMLQFEPALVVREIGSELRGAPELATPALRDRAVKARLEYLFRLVTAAGSESLALEEALLRTLLLVFGRYGSQAPKRPGLSPTVAKARQRLDDAPAAATSLSELASLSGVSRFQLLRGFAREVGTTPHAYLVQRRANSARQLLSAGATPADAATGAGFADQSHMTRAFVRQFGITPARYRAAVT